MDEKYDDLVTDFRVKMETFMRGEWTLEMPDKPGTYPVCGRNCPPDGSTIVVVYLHSTTGKPTPTHTWGGWWWSEPLPDLPPTPDAPWKDDESAS